MYFPTFQKTVTPSKNGKPKPKNLKAVYPEQGLFFLIYWSRQHPKQIKAKENDLADFLIKLDWRPFREQERTEQPPTPAPEPEKVTKVTKVTVETNNIFSDEFDFIKWLQQDTEPLPFENEVKQDDNNRDWADELWKRKGNKEQPKNWNNEIAEIETYFVAAELPTQPVKLNECSIITNCSLFIESHLATVKANNGKETFLPYLNRLQEFKQILTLN